MLLVIMEAIRFGVEMPNEMQTEHPVDIILSMETTDYKHNSVPSCYSFRDIMITNFQSPNLQREIIRKK